MADIFLSYAHEDRVTANRLAEAFQNRGWTVFWDRSISIGHRYDEEIETELDHSKCVVVLWSETSIRKDWVLAEANEGRTRNVLVPILIGRVRLPLEFRRLQSADIVNGSLNGSEFANVIAKIEQLAGVPQVSVAPDINRYVLDNGLRLLTERVRHTASLCAGVWIVRGSRHDPRDLRGIAHFTMMMTCAGTTRRSRTQIDEAVAAIDGQWDAFVAREYASYYIKTLDTHAATAIDILADIVRNPRLHQSDIKHQKQVVLAELKELEETPDDVVHELFTHELWQGHPLSWPIIGQKESLDLFDEKEICNYVRDVYTAPNMVLTIVSALDHRLVRNIVESQFGTLSSREIRVAESAPIAHPSVRVHTSAFESSHICLGASVTPHRHPDRFPMYVLNTLAGGYENARLPRATSDLAPTVFSGISSFRDAGMLSIYANCAHEATIEVLRRITDELRRLKRSRASNAELDAAKAHLKSSLVTSLDTVNARMAHMAREEIYFGRQYELETTLERIDRVTAEDVSRVADEVFRTGALSLTILGNVERRSLSDDLLRVSG